MRAKDVGRQLGSKMGTTGIMRKKSNLTTVSLMGLGLSDLVQKNTGQQVKFEFQLENE